MKPALPTEVEALRNRIAELERELRRREQATAFGDSHTLVAAILEATDEAIITTDLDGSIRTWHDRAELVFGYANVEVIGKPLASLFADEDGRQIAAALETIRRGGRVTQLNVHDRQHSGTTKTITVRASAVRDRGGRAHGCLFVARASDRGQKQFDDLRLAEERSRLAIEAGNVGVWDWDVVSNTVTWSDRVYQLHGLPPGSFGGTVEDFSRLVHPEDLHAVAEALRRAMDEDVPYQLEFRIVRPDGEVRWLSTSARVMRDGDGRATRLLGATLDITERKRTENALRGTSQQLQATITACPLPIVALTGEGAITLWNPAAERVFGWKAEEVLGSPLPFIPADKREEHRRMRARDLTGVGFTNQEIRRQRKDGTLIDLSVSTAAVKDPAGRVTGIMSVYVDVTERKRLEHELRESEAKFRALVEQSPMATQVISLDGRILRANRAWQKLFGVTVDQVADFNSFADPQLAEKGVLAFMLRARAGENVEIPETPFVPDRGERAGETLWVRAAAYPLRDEHGAVSEVVLVQEDVTERRRAERALREREGQLALFIETAPAAIAMFDQEMRYVAVSRRFIQDFQLPDNILGRSHYEVFPNIPDRWKQVHQRCLQGAEERADEDSFVAPDGRMEWLRWEIHPWYKAEGTIGGLVLASELITAQKRAKEQLRHAAQRFSLALRNSQISVFEQDRDLRYTWAHNESTVFRPELLVGRADWEINPGPWWEEITPIKRRVIDTGSGERHELVIPVQGEPVHYDMTLEPLRDEAGQVVGLSGSAVNITALKRIEQSLRESEERYRFLAEALPQFVWTRDETGQINYINAHWTEYTGLTLQAARSGEWLELVHPDDRPAVVEAAQLAVQGKDVEVEYRLRRKADGMYRWHLARGQSVPESHEGTRWIEVATDIHDRREAESRSQLLAASGVALGSSLNYEETLGAVARLAVPVIADWSAVDLLDEGERLQRVAIQHSDPALVEFAHELQRRYPPRPDDVTWQVIRTGQSFYLQEIPDSMIDERAVDADHAQAVRRLGLRAIIVTPMIARERVLGVLTFATAESGRRYTRADVHFAEDLACRAAVAIDNARLYAAVQSSEERLRLLFETAGEGICLCDVRGRAILANPRTGELFGCTPEDLTGRSIFDFVPEELRQSALDSFQRRIEGDTSPAREYPIQRADGKKRWLRVSASVLRDGHGNPDAVLGMFSDITDFRAAMEELRASEARFRELADAVPAFVWTTSPEGDVTYFNNRWYDYTGLTPEQSMGAGWVRTLAPEDVERVGSGWSEARQQEKPYSIECRYRNAQGEYRWFMARALPVRDEKGRVVQWFGTSTDIHEAKRVEEELRQANRDLEQFAYSASHDLQEPLRVVAIYSQLLHRRYAGKLDRQADEYLNFTLRGALRMEALVNDLLAYTRTVREGGEATAPAVSANVALDQALANLSSAIDDAGASIDRRELPEVKVQEVHLVQVFQNLLQNAIKYRGDHPPQITISGERASGGFWKISVRDNGIGIHPEYHELVFGLFKRLHNSERYAGTGIGLALCQKIVQRYGGRIWVESDGPGRGSTFCFTVPGADPHRIDNTVEL